MNEWNDILPSAGACLDDIAVERSVTEREVLGVLAEQFREDGLTLVASRVLVDVAVHEAVHQRRMGVNVNVEIQVDVLHSSTTLDTYTTGTLHTLQVNVYRYTIQVNVYR